MGKPRHNFKNMEIWKRGLTLSVEIFKLTREFPNEEKYSLISQMRRAAVSIHSNIAEGSGRNSSLDFSRFLHYSIGSINELESQLIYAYEVGYLNQSLYDDFQKEMVELQKMIYSFEEYIKKL